MSTVNLPQEAYIMAYIVNKYNSYYAVFGINGKKKWIKIGNVDKKDAKKALKLLEIEHLFNSLSG